MMRKLRFNTILVFIPIFIFGCNRNNNAKPSSSDTGFFDTSGKSSEVAEPNYPDAPDPDDFYKSPDGLRLIDTLQSRFNDNFIAFNNEVNTSHAKLYVCYITTEVGAALTM